MANGVGTVLNLPVKVNSSNALVVTGATGFRSLSVVPPNITAAVAAVVPTTTPNQQLNSVMAVLEAAAMELTQTLETGHLVLLTQAVAAAAVTGKVVAPKVVLELSLFATQQLLRQSTQ